jgi:hypothetical protein
MVTAGLALPFVLLGFFVGFFLEGTLLLAGSLLAMASGWLALRGIMPYLTIVGAALLIAGAVAIVPASGFGVIYVLIGLVMALASLAMILMGFRDLTLRAEARARSPVPR